MIGSLFDRFWGYFDLLKTDYGNVVYIFGQIGNFKMAILIVK
jgi:hypothetical protein